MEVSPPSSRCGKQSRGVRANLSSLSVGVSKIGAHDLMGIRGQDALCNQKPDRGYSLYSVRAPAERF